MSKWELIEDETAARMWDKNLIQLSDCSPFQTYAWGEYNRALGWQPLYFAAFNENGEVEAMCLGLLRRYPLGIGLMWCPGGLVGDVQAWDENLRKTILEAAGLKHLYLRFRCDRERNVRDVLFLNNANWTRTSFMMTSGLSMELDLTQTEDELLAKLSNNWRRSLKRAQKNDLVIKQCSNPNIEELCRVFAEMEAIKNLPQLFTPEKLENLFKYVKENLIFLRCENEKGELLGFHAFLTVGRRACHYFGATSEEGRKMSASFPVYWEAILQCQRKGVICFELGGIDPAANPGVYKFKRETGAREVEFLGEWDWATSEWLRILGNWAIKRRQDAKPVKVKDKTPKNYRFVEWLRNSFSVKKRTSVINAQSPVK